jgi:hypothetical protein
VTANDWATVASLATALGTLVLAVATFSSVRSGNRTARAAEQSLQEGLRPLLLSSHMEDQPLKISFLDRRWMRIPGGCAVTGVGGGDGTAGSGDDVLYLAMSLRNAGRGIAVLHGWVFYPERLRSVAEHPAPEEFRTLTRDLYIPPGEPGFWQGTFRDPADPEYDPARKVIESRQPWTVDLLYGDHEGGQRVISRYSMLPRINPAKEEEKEKEKDPAWIVAVSRHWNIDRADPR